VVSVSDICALTFKGAALTGEEGGMRLSAGKKKGCVGRGEGKGAAESESF